MSEDFNLTSILPMLMMGNMSEKGVMSVVISGLVCLFLKYFDMHKIRRFIVKFLSKTKMSFSMEARVTSTRESTMSSSFCAVAHHVHTTLKNASCRDPLWKNVKNIKELQLDRRSIVVNVFTDGYYVDVDSGVEIRITCDNEINTIQNPDNNRLPGISEKVEAWTITISSSTRGYDSIEEFTKKCNMEFDAHLKSMSTNSKQTLFTVQSCSKIGHGFQTSRALYSEEAFISTKTFDNLFFPKKKDLMKKIDRFENDEGYYSRMGIPYKLHMMFHGSAGVSKTSAIKAIANYTGKHVVWMRLDRFDSVAQICDAIANFSTEQSIDYKRCMFVIEEFDCFDEQPIRRTTREEPVSGNEPLDLLRALTKNSQETKCPSPKSCLGTMLNTFDGIKEMHGCMVIFTTNHPEKFDPALTRAGRIDKIEFDLLGPTEIADYWKLRFNKDLSEKMKSEMDGMKRILSTSGLSEILSQECDEAEVLLSQHVTMIKNSHEVS